MSYLIGVDEAGYGPNLGPLVVSATVWKTDDGPGDADLYERLAEVIVRRPGRNGRPHGARVAMADSKALYRSGKGLAVLERGLLAALGAIDRRPASWRELWDVLDPRSHAQRAALPWYAAYDGPVPVEADKDELAEAAARVRTGMRAAGVRLLDIASRAVFSKCFNELVTLHGSKGTALSHATLELVAEQVGRLPDGPVLVVCDKHGGRSGYRGLLEDHFDGALVEIGEEGRQQSVYRFGPDGRRVEMRFQVKAEQWLPAALASMASKYLREMAMRAFNHFWSLRVPRLRPTAGYPQDAKRFRADIAGVQASMGIEDRVLWRCR